MDFYDEGYNRGRGWTHKTTGDFPQTAGDRASFESGYEYGERRRRISDELDREMYGD